MFQRAVSREKEAAMSSCFNKESTLALAECLPLTHPAPGEDCSITESSKDRVSQVRVSGKGKA